MDILVSCIIKSVLASGVLYSYYQLALKNKKFHSYNRFYLLGAILVSLVIPFISFDWLTIEDPKNTPLADMVNMINDPVANPADQSAAVGWILTGISILVSSCFLLLLASKISWIYRLKRTHKNIPMPGFMFIETGITQAPFSFLNNMFWKRGLLVTDANGERIFRHELAHIRQKHTYDKLFIQLVCCIGWINPFYWLIQKELSTVHEFIADAAAVEEGDAESFAKMLLYSHNRGSYLSPVHPFFNSSIKRRLIMITLSNKPRYSYVRRVLVLPIALALLAILSVGTKAQPVPRTKSAVPVLRLAAMDTVPKPVLKEITVKGKKLNKKPALEPIKVEEKKLEKKPAQAHAKMIPGKKLKKTPALKLAPITVEGYEIEKKPEAVTKPVKETEKNP